MLIFIFHGFVSGVIEYHFNLAGGATDTAVNMNFQREYAERYDWMKEQFIDWTFTCVNSFLYYEDYDTLNEDTRQNMQQSMTAFGENG